MFILREDLENDFDISSWNDSQRCMKCAKELFPHSPRQAEQWAIGCYHKWTTLGILPEQQRDRRNPHWRKSLELYNKRKQTRLMYYS